MKRRRHDVVELSSDDSSDDFVPAKLKSKRVSIVLNREPVSLKSRKNGHVSRSLKQQQSSSAKRSDQSESEQGEEKEKKGGKLKNEEEKRGELKKEGKSRERLTLKLPLSSAEVLKTKSANRTAKLKPEFSDLDDSLLIESVKPASSKTASSTENNEKLSSTKLDVHSESSSFIKMEVDSKPASPIHSSTLLPSRTAEILLSHSSMYGERGGVSSSSSYSNDTVERKSVSSLSSEKVNQEEIISANSSDDTIGVQIEDFGEEKKLGSKEGASSSLGYSFCQICQKNISGFSAERRRSHVNKCCDELEKVNNFGVRSSLNSRGKRRVPARVNCPLCPKNYSDKWSLKKHLKSCCKEHGKCYETVCEVYCSSSKKTVEDDTKKKETKKKKGKEAKPTALLVGDHSAISDAQNKILDLIADQDSEDSIPPTPALKASKLTTYRSKRNSIWNVANSATTTVTTVLKHENSLINTPKLDTSLSDIPPLPASIPDDPICLEKSSLPSQADITQLTQFLSDLGKDDSMKERLTSLMVSPSKIRSESAASSKISETDGQSRSIKYKCPEVSSIQIQNSFKKSKPGSVKSDHSDELHIKIKVESKSNPQLSLETEKLSESGSIEVIEPLSTTNEADSIQPENDFDPTREETPLPIMNIPSPPTHPTSESDTTVSLTDQQQHPQNPPTDKSPNPSDISAVGEGSHIRTPARDTSEMVSSIREDVESTSNNSVQEDSNLDLFSDHPPANGVSRLGREVFDRSPDRSLLNVSPITDSGLNEVEGTKPPVLIQSLAQSKREISPIYRPKQCSSTTRDNDVLTVPTPLSHKNIQVTLETRNSAVGTEVKTRAKGSNTESVECRNQACNTDSVNKASFQTQADGERSCSAMMRRLRAHATSTDITLLCADWTEKRAHRLILQIFCPQLLLNTPQFAGEVKLELGSEAAEYFLEFVYTRVIEVEAMRPVILSELFDIAERLEMTELLNHLHTKRTETIEFEFQQESGARIQLNLSARDVLNLSQQIERVSSQNRSLVSQNGSVTSPEHHLDNHLDNDLDNHLDNTSFQQDFPSFQQHEVFPPASPDDKVDLLDGDLFDKTRDIEVVCESISIKEQDNIGNCTNLTENSDIEDLPASGIVLEQEEEASPSPPAPVEQMSEEDKRASQLNQDIEFIDLVKQLDDPVINSPLSFIDNLSPIKLDEDNKDISLINVDSCNSSLITDSPAVNRKPAISTPEPASSASKPAISTPEPAESTPKPAAPRSKRVIKTTGLSTPSHVRTSHVTTPSNLDLSAYNKTPNYKDMDTPRLKAEVGKFGLKPLSKKRAVAKLEEIHRFTNKKFLKCPTEEEDEEIKTSKRTKTIKAGRSQSSKESSSSRSPSSGKKKRRDSTSSSSSEKECPVGDITVSEKLPKSATREVGDQVRSAIRSKEELHSQVLKYHPVDIIEIKGLLKRRTSVGLIAQVLDDLGITYFNSETKAKGFRGKGASRKTRK